MASKGRKGKSTNKTTAWSQETWDERGYFVSYRYGANGEPEYNYRYPEEPEAPDPQTPRSPGQTPFSVSAYPNPSPYRSSSYDAYTNSSYSADTTSDAGPSDSQNYGYNLSSTSGGATGSDYATKTLTYNQKSVSPLLNGANYTAVSDTLRPAASSVPSSTLSYPVSSSRTADAYPSPTSYSSAQSYGAQPSADILTESFKNISMSPSALPGSGLNSVVNQQYPSFTGGSTSSTNQLDPRYKVVEDRNLEKFWKVGRVFLVPWTEPARDAIQPTQYSVASSQGDPQYCETYLGVRAFTEIRRFVVIQKNWGSCLCSPIHTYNGRATLKPNLPDRQQHAIIYTSSSPPSELSYTAEDGTVVRENLTKDSIKVRSEQRGPEGDLGIYSRLNYSKIYTIEQYCTVLNIGMVADEWMITLLNNSPVRPRSPAKRPRKDPPPPEKQKGRDKESGSSRRHRSDKSGHK